MDEELWLNVLGFAIIVVVPTMGVFALHWINEADKCLTDDLRKSRAMSFGLFCLFLFGLIGFYNFMMVLNYCFPSGD